MRRPALRIDPGNFTKRIHESISALKISYLVRRLRHPGDSDEAKASLALFIAAAAALGLVFATDRADITSATLVLCGFACFIAGIFILTFHRGEAVAPDTCERLDPGARIALAQTASALGVDGDAVILPGGSGLLQWNGSGASSIPASFSGSSLVVYEGAVGLAIPPLSLPLWRHLQETYGLITPDGVEAALAAYREALTVCLELADSVTAGREGDHIILEISGYHLFEGCRIMHDESPKCCTSFPCAVCGLAGVILADATGSAWVYDRIVLSIETRSVMITLSQHTG